jgi:hypothetical protein
MANFPMVRPDPEPTVSFLCLIFGLGPGYSGSNKRKKTIASIDIDIRPKFWIQAFFIFFISSLVLHLGQALGLFTLVSHP